jgi:DNA-binding SARP family transcriptional activator/tetratricopeptide (TPR) repeat protein/TolB-like protein
MFDFRTLGVLDLRTPDGREVSSLLAQPKRVALLTYLATAVPPGFHRRDELVVLFWPERDQEHARTALRKALHFLRHALGNGVILTRGAEDVGLDPALLQCDTAMFERLLEEGQAREALDRYRGHFLSGFHLSRCPEFERWMEKRRALLRERAARAAWSLAEAAEAEGSTVDAAHWARCTAEFSPDDEGLLRRVVALLDRVGDRAGAIHTYGVFAQHLLAEDGVDPAPETVSLVETVRARVAPSGRAEVGVVATRTPRAELPPGVGVAASDRDSGSLAGPLQERGRSAWRPHRHARTFAGLGVAILAVGTLAIRQGYLPFSRIGRSESALLSNRVVVIPFANETGDPSLAPIGQMTADWVTEGLAQSGLVQIITLPTVLKALDTTDSASTHENAGARTLAGAVGANTVIWGSYYRSGDELAIQAQVTNTRDRTLLGAVGPVRASPRAMSEGLATLRQRVMGLLAVRLDQRLAPWASDIRQPPQYEAYLEYVQGLEATDWEEKGRHFVRATDLDPSFTRAWFEAIGNSPDADTTRDWNAWVDSAYTTLRRLRKTMSLADRYTLDGMEAARRQDWRAQYRAARKAALYAPDKRPFLAISAFNLGRYQEMVDVWLSDSTPAILQPPDPLATKQVTAALHFLGAHERELALARQGKRAHPGHINFYEMETTALAALGRISELEAAVEEVRDLGPIDGWYDQPTFLFIVGNELLWHGHDSAARRMLERAEGLRRVAVETQGPRTGTLPRLFAPNADNAHDLAQVLLFLGRWHEAQLMLRQLYAQDSDPHDLADIGIAAARSGEREEALRIMRDLGRLPWPESWQRTWHQAYVAGALEDCELMVTLLRKSFSEGAFYQILHRRLGFYFCRNYPGFVELAKPHG